MGERPFEVRCDSPAATHAIAERIGRLAEPGDAFALRGTLGAGKTHFVQGLARGLGVPDTARVCSPTFNIVLEHQGRATLVHIDLYRLERDAEVDEIGLDHYLSSDAVCAVEWFDRFPRRVPRDYLEIAFTIEGPSLRTLTFMPYGGRSELLLAAWRATLT